ncbi:glycoside hydrolase family 3 protein [Bifidobacterium sp. SO4]|uniref:glycoside hydrolase family 3 protein n=1 Tax=Bifidobacterium sp. SO4 TaxID=2809030 RepID=UPI001BDD0604|nr:glycoside hydrolase family 3 protein [Bifidobacterium sp. SO4]MBT1170667.1 glycoside hydrolase family 3 protein [Bifidobacterium sp. SO4]
MSSKTRLRMNNRKFTIIWTTVVSVLVVLALAATVAMNFFSLSMEIFLGRGEQVVKTDPDMANVDTAYYKDVADNLDEHTNQTALSIAEQGIVLMKNDADTLPLAKGSDVTPLGYRYISPIYGGTGSGSVNTSSSRIYTAQRALGEYFKVNDAAEQAMEKATARGMDADGYQGPDEKAGFTGATDKIIEYDPSIYQGIEDSAHGTTGIVFIGRSGGEGRDVTANVPGSPIEGKGYADGTPHQLALSKDEKDTIRFAKANCDKVVVVLDTSNVMEIGDLMAEGSDLSADAVVWIGGPGGQGFKALAEILTGEVNPSGRTVDTWMTDIMADPSMSNFGNAEYKDLYLLQGGYPTPVGDPTEMNFIEYEENVYVGYRYYETLDDTGGTFTVNGKTGQDYDAAVQMPFGYGLSYGTDFTQRIVSSKDDDKSVTLNVEVTNNGDKAGKDVVQVYYNPPYTDYDKANGIEKSTVNLIAFEKTGDIAPGASQDVTVTISKEDMASYSYKRENPDGTKGAYLLEEGDYTLSVNKNAHEEYGSVKVNVPETIWYDNDNPRQSDIDAQSTLDEEGNPTGKPANGKTFKAATNLFQDMSDHMESTDQLIRADGPLANTATFPTEQDKDDIPDGFHYTTDSEGRKILQQMDLDTDTTLGNVKDSKVYTDSKPKTNADNGLTLSDLRGADFNDPKWDQLLDQLDLNESSLYVALAASYDQTAQIGSISKPATVDFDGPQGIVGSITDATEYTAYPTEPIIAATFNKDLAREMGDSVGQEAAAAGVNSWYAPAANIHRSPFSGRNFEYYSEDPVLSGLMLTSEVSGAADQGLITTIKHFALNDQEMYDNDRSRVATWANEQAMREIYLKPFEMAIKNVKTTVKYVNEGKQTVSKTIRGATAVMGCMNYLGTTWGGADYALNTELLRDEWGFNGFLISDMVMNAGSNSVDQALRSGTDSWMAWGTAFTSLIGDKTSATGVSTIRRAVKDMSYAIVNSRTMNGIAPGTQITYKTSPWKIWLGAADAVIAVFTLGMAVVMIRRTRDAKAHPERYKVRKARRNRKAGTADDDVMTA